MKTSRETPSWLVDKMWHIVQDHVVQLPMMKFTLLEPSAGEGNLLNHFLNNKYDVTTVELNVEKCKKLKKYSDTNYHGDFLQLEFNINTFDVVLAAPPFNNNIDVVHIQKMYDVLKRDGIIVTLTSPYWVTNNESHQVKFREWLKDKSHKMIMLPDMTFVEKKKTVPTAILVIKK